MRVVPFAVATVIAFAPLWAAAQAPGAGPVPAEEPAPPAPTKADSAGNVPPRYSFHPAETGFLRLDGQTGQVAFCGPRRRGWSCDVVPEDRASLERQVTRLQDEVASLKQELADLRRQSAAPDAGERKTQLLKPEDIARARAYFEDAWRRLVEMLQNFQKDVMRKT